VLEHHELIASSVRSLSARQGGPKQNPVIIVTYQLVLAMDIDPGSFVGKTIIIGITRLSASGKLIDQTQMHGSVTEASSKRFAILLSTGDTYDLPPDYRNVQPAAPGEYKFRSTGEVVVNPDLTTTWTITEPRKH